MIFPKVPGRSQDQNDGSIGISGARGATCERSIFFTFLQCFGKNELKARLFFRPAWFENGASAAQSQMEGGWVLQPNGMYIRTASSIDETTTEESPYSYEYSSGSSSNSLQSSSSTEGSFSSGSRSRRSKRSGGSRSSSRRARGSSIFQSSRRNGSISSSYPRQESSSNSLTSSGWTLMANETHVRDTRNSSMRRGRGRDGLSSSSSGWFGSSSASELSSASYPASAYSGSTYRGWSNGGRY